MKILTIFEDGRVGGPHKQFFYFFKTLHKKNIDQHFLIMPGLNKKLKFKKEINLLKINIVYLSYYNLFPYLKTFLRDIMRITSTIKKLRIDKVYIAGGSSCIKSVLASIISRRKFIWHIHDSKNNKLLYFFFNIFKYFSEKIIFVSKKSKNFYLKKNSYMNYHILPSAVDVNHFHKKCFNNKILYTILIIANINPDKDILMLIDLVNYVEKKNKNIKFKLVGKVWKSQNEYFKKIKKKIRINKLKNIYIINNVDNVEKHLKNSDILLLTSANESMPLSVCEAMSSSKPIISTDVGDVKYFVELNRRKLIAGKVFEKKNFKSMGEYILELYKNSKKLKKLSRNSKKVSEIFFNIFQYKKKLYNFFNV